MTSEVTETSAAGPENDSRDALFGLLTEEIKDLNEADKRQGWTPWVLCATLISMAWLVVQDAWSVHPSAASVHAVFLLVSAGIWLTIDVNVLFDTMSTNVRGKLPFFFIHTNTSALNAFVGTLWTATIAAACFTLPLAGAEYVRWAAGGLYALTAISGFAMLVAVVARLPLPVERGHRLREAVMPMVSTLITAALIFNLYGSDTITAARIGDIRIGGLLALGAYALVLLSRGESRHSAMKQTLTELRRDLTFGTLPLDEARHRTRATLQGMWLSDAVRDDVRTLLGLLSDVRALCGDALRKTEALKMSVPITAPYGARLAEFEKFAVSNTLDVLMTYEKRVASISEQYSAHLRDMTRRVGLVSVLVRSASSDQQQVMTEVEMAQAPADAARFRFAREFHDIQSAWNEWYPAEARHHNPFGFSMRDVDASRAQADNRPGAPAH
jgi:hypothetical protein